MDVERQAGGVGRFKNNQSSCFFENEILTILFCIVKYFLARCYEDLVVIVIVDKATSVLIVPTCKYS